MTSKNLTLLKKLAKMMNDKKKVSRRKSRKSRKVSRRKSRKPRKVSKRKSRKSKKVSRRKSRKSRKSKKVSKRKLSKKQISDLIEAGKSKARKQKYTPDYDTGNLFATPV